MSDQPPPGALVGVSPVIRELRERLPQLGCSSVNILIEGETGVGKEIVARGIHAASPRVVQPFVAVNCGAFVETLLESELFGHVKGAFTGAVADRSGLFEAAAGGTLLLDEVAEMRPETQARFLRVLEDQRYSPVGSSATKRADVRVLAATNRCIQEELAEGRFRKDLFYRLAGEEIFIPPLRERPEDIEPLAAHFLDILAIQTGRPPLALSRAALDRLKQDEWPGNVRRLRVVVERAYHRATGAAAIDTGHVEEAFKSFGRRSTREIAIGGRFPPKDWIPRMPDSFRKLQILEEGLVKAGGNVTKAAETLGMSRYGLRLALERLRREFLG